jgi:hypothetical protein
LSFFEQVFEFVRETAQSCSKLFKAAQSCSKLLKAAESCSKLLKAAQSFDTPPKCSQKDLRDDTFTQFSKMTCMKYLII